MPVPGFFIVLLAGMAIRLASTGNGSAVATGCLPVCIVAAHGLRALALAMRADMRLALALLLGGAAFGFLGFGPPQVAAVFPGAVVFGGASFLEGDCDRLPAVLDLACLAATAAVQCAMLELMHHPAGDPLLPR